VNVFTFLNATVLHGIANCECRKKTGAIQSYTMSAPHVALGSFEASLRGWLSTGDTCTSTDSQQRRAEEISRLFCSLLY